MPEKEPTQNEINNKTNTFIATMPQTTPST